jgi:hypothetical protein
MKNKKGTAEIVGTALFLVILFFFFSNVFLWHNSVTREMDQLIADKMNSAVRLETTIGGGNPSYAFTESITHGSPQDTFDSSVTSSPDGNSHSITEVPVSNVYTLNASYTFNTGITSQEKMRLIASVQINVRATFDDPDFEGCVIGIWDCIDKVVVNTGIGVIKGYRWSNVTLSPAERYIDTKTGIVKIGFLDATGGVSVGIWGGGGSSQWSSSPDPNPGTLRIDCMIVIPEPVALEVTNLGGLDVMLSRLWITNSTETVNPTNDHLYADLEPLNMWIPAGSRQTITLSDITSLIISGNETSLRVSGNEVYYVPPNGASVIFKILTKNGNTAACSYTFPLIAAPKLGFTAGTSQTLTAGTVSSVITVQRLDQYSNPTTTGSTIVSLTTTSPGGKFYSNSGGTTQITSVTISTGSSSANFYYKDTAVGTPTLTASSTDLTSATTQFILNPGALASFTITGCPSSMTAGNNFGSNNVVVTAYDTNDNVKTDYTGSVYFTSTDVQAVLPYTSSNRYTFTSGDNGIHTFDGTGFTLKTAGSRSITVFNGTVSATSNSITVNPVGLDHFMVTASGGRNIGTQTAGKPFSITVTAYDTYNNVKTDYAGPATLSDLSSSINTTSTGSFTNGAVTLSVKIANSYINDRITATDNGKTGQSNQFNVNAPTPLNLIRNPGFEVHNSTWSEQSNYGGFADHYYGSYYRSGTGSRCGRTSTISPSGSNCYANLSQSLTTTAISSIPDISDSLTVYLRNRGSASNGYYTVEVRIYSGIYMLSYIWCTTGQFSSYSNSTYSKYIRIGDVSSIPDSYASPLIRNLRADWISVNLSTSLQIDSIRLTSNGNRTGPSGNRLYYGQDIVWDDLQLLYYP